LRASLDQGSVEYDDRGRGDALLLLHAFPLARFMWDALAAALAPSFRVIAFDARGFGASPLGEGPLTMDRIADDAAELLDGLGVAQAVVGGCSMGGYAAFAFARRHPARLRALYLQDTRAVADGEEARRGRASLAERVLREGAAPAVDALLPKLLGATTQREQPGLVRALTARILATSPQAIVNALHGLAARADSRETLPKLRVPTLVLAGSEDAIVPLAESDAMAQAIPGARLEIVPRAGHLANLEQPEAVAAALSGFLKGL
jgi:pimeloyl-ACP methyl ester carboxylesterase